MSIAPVVPGFQLMRPTRQIPPGGRRWRCGVCAGEILDRSDARGPSSNHPTRRCSTCWAAAYRVRHPVLANTVQLFFLTNAKSGLCPEDCGYCSQSKVSDAEIPALQPALGAKLLEAARLAAERQSKTFCIVISAAGALGAGDGFRLLGRARDQAAVRPQDLRWPRPAEPEQAERLAAAGVDKVNHNLNTSERYYGEICTTHTYADRVATLAACRTAGLELCSGGIMGMGETHDDLIDMALELRRLSVESIPLNFLNCDRGHAPRIDQPLTPRDCLPRPGDDAAGELVGRDPHCRRP